MIGTVATRFNLLRSYHHFLRSSLSFLSLSSFEIWEQDRDCSLVIEVIAEKQVKLLLRLIMGISKAVGVVGLVFFFAAVYLKDLSMKLIPLSLLYDSFIASLVSVASHPVINFPLIFGKGSNGKFPLWSKILFFPFLFLVRVYAFFKRLKSREPIYNEISEGLYVGGWPSSKKHLPPGDPAVIDCTCELPRSSVVSEDAYLCLPTWDTRAPQPSQIETAVRWASKMWAQKKPIYVHCAFGHGRSVCVICAVLVTLGVAEDWKAAEKLVREKRPRIRMNALHRKHLEEWSKITHLSNRT